MKKNLEPHKIHVVFQPQTNKEKLKVITCHCSCKAGITGAGCAHLPAFFYTLLYLVINFKEVPEELTFTLGLPNHNMKKKQSLSSNLFDPRPEFMKKKNPERIKKFKEQMLSISPHLPIGYLLDPDCSVTDTVFGEMQECSSIIYQLENIADKTPIEKAPDKSSIPLLNILKCGDT